VALPDQLEQVESKSRRVDGELAHYEGDHIVLRPKDVTAEQVLSALETLHRNFYSWRSTLMRWLRLLGAYVLHGKGRLRVLRFLLISYILFELSLFQRHRARRKVFRLLSRQAPCRAPTGGPWRRSSCMVGLSVSRALT